MLQQIKNRLKKNIFIYVPYRMIVDKDFKAYCADYYNNSRNFRFEHLGKENREKNIYYICEGSSVQGMFSIITWTLRRLEVADRFHFIPVVTWVKDVPVNYNNHQNPFLIYFLPTSDISEDSVKKSADVAFAKKWDSAYAAQVGSYDFSQDEINRLAEIYRKYLKLQPNIQSKIDREIRELLGEVRKQKVLGVHVRGVEWRQKQVLNHPVAITIEDYLEMAKKMMSEMGYNKIFLAADSEEAIDCFKGEFGESLLEYYAVRTPVGSSQLSIFNEGNDSFQMGYEVLRDAITLASCDALLCGLSYVSYGARIIKQSYGDNFEKIIVLDKGKVNDGISLEKAEKWQREI